MGVYSQRKWAFLARNWAHLSKDLNKIWGLAMATMYTLPFTSLPLSFAFEIRRNKTLRLLIFWFVFQISHINKRQEDVNLLKLLQQCLDFARCIHSSSKRNSKWYILLI